MNKKAKVIITFIISFCIAFLIVGYFSNIFTVKIHWITSVTAWMKAEYYFKVYSVNALIAALIAIIPAIGMLIAYKPKSNI
jgi:hypothetical protein